MDNLGKEWLVYEDYKDLDLAKKLHDWCCRGFPYVCEGKKKISSKGLEVICECGNRVKV